MYEESKQYIIGNNCKFTGKKCKGTIICDLCPIKIRGVSTVKKKG